MPRDEEYSRLTDPGRYGVVHSRARVWAEELAELPDVASFALPDGGGFRLASSRPGTLPLLLLTRDEPFPLLDLCAARPDVVLQSLPDCGCDACDRGSDDLLDAIDETIGTVVDGPLVVLCGDGWQARWWPHGGSSSGTGRHVALMELCRRLADREDVRVPEGTEVLIGRSWLG
ncbi:hypothetical protein PSU4_16720 [Pseudonocardia sulfidoxydans NBRC 16205]|uniref:Uncharacterized protein n=1 Tax=Pseudonocardia sulfidoxydans NBRC 16205 TaxID=1223511 RepID=A0A511DI90_9PSEU|nr:hypothetical protein PSU4_16720 [Pseudonocardia sulfidoxydans NBRC 16205]